MRFFGYLKQLPHNMLARFTQIDYDHKIVLVALYESESGEKMVEVSRLITESNQEKAEFAVIIGDSWQGKGIGSELLKRCCQLPGNIKLKKFGVLYYLKTHRC